MRSRARKLVLLALTCGVMAATSLVAGPANAVVEKSGSKSCGYNQFVSIRGYGSGVLKFYYPSTTYKTSSDHGSAIYATTVSTGKNSATWKVTSTGYLQDAGTYASCSPSPAPPT